MLSGDFARKIKQLNPFLRIYCGDDPNRAATLFFSKYNMGLDNPEDYVEICGVDKNYLPELPIRDKVGHLKKGGWRRVLNMLIRRRLVNQQKAERLFQTSFETVAMLPPLTPEDDPILRAIRDAEQHGLGKVKTEDGRVATHYRTDEMMDIAKMIHAKKNRG